MFPELLLSSEAVADHVKELCVFDFPSTLLTFSLAVTVALVITGGVMRISDGKPRGQQVSLTQLWIQERSDKLAQISGCFRTVLPDVLTISLF